MQRHTLLPLLLTAGLSTALIILWFTYRTPSYPPEIIEQSAIDSIDFDRLPPPVARFIQQARENKTVGRNTSDFPDLWQYAISGNNERARKHDSIFYQFLLPMTEEQQAEFDQSIQAGIFCWPMLGVHVDAESSTITATAVYTQCS